MSRGEGELDRLALRTVMLGRTAGRGLRRGTSERAGEEPARPFARAPYESVPQRPAGAPGPPEAGPTPGPEVGLGLCGWNASRFTAAGSAWFKERECRPL